MSHRITISDTAFATLSTLAATNCRSIGGQIEVTIREATQAASTQNVAMKPVGTMRLGSSAGAVTSADRFRTFKPAPTSDE